MNRNPRPTLKASLLPIQLQMEKQAQAIMARDNQVDYLSRKVVELDDRLAEALLRVQMLERPKRQWWQW